MIANPTLPDGWTSEDLGSPFLLIRTREDQHGCFVTVDFADRGWRGGLTKTGPLVPRDHRRYIGRGWRDRLIADAVAHLQEVIK